MVTVDAFAWQPLPRPDTMTTFMGLTGAFGGPNYGSFTGPSECLRFPPVYTMWGIINGDTLSVTWRPDDPEGVYVQVTIPAMGISGVTRTFVPGDAPGWDVAFVADTAAAGVSYVLQVSADSACVPSS